MAFRSFCSAATRQLAEFAKAWREFPLVGHENRKSLLDGKADRAPRTDQLLFVTRECRLPIRIEGAAKEGEEGVVHGCRCPIRPDWSYKSKGS